jgi:DNA-binding transcriptional MerR regulator
VHSKVYALSMLTVSKLAKRAGMTPDAVRFYEREALLPVAPRTEAGYRVYGEETVERIRFIKGAQRVGLRLREIREMLEVLDRGLCPCGHAEALLRSRMAEIEAEVERLRGVRTDLARALDRLPEACPDGWGGWDCVTKEGSDGASL